MEQTRGYGVEPLPLDSVDTEAPFCPHGPTLLFERYYADKKPRSFFACSVHRNRKGCQFFHWADEAISVDKRKRWLSVFRESQLTLDRGKLQSAMEAITSLSENERCYCYQCEQLLSSPASHSTHSIVRRVTTDQLLHPTKLLAPVDNRKSQAQFYFSDSSLQFLTGELSRLDFTKVLCIGTPRLHEALCQNSGMESLLLDIDHRYAQFYSPDKFQRFNMFTSYFYEDGGRGICERFLSHTHSKTAIVVDPPFGGLAKVLATALEGLWKMAGGEMSTFLIFPYFMESHVKAALPSLWMMDYQVTYDNHKHFSAERKPSKPSPVRVYTNYPRPGLRLPADGYRLCSPCDKYVASCNAHCEICYTCPSKDGRPYKHCFDCGECVKPGRVHCTSCNKCELREHNCGTRPAVGCHVCGSLEHKRKDCPTKSQPSPSKKRKRSSTSGHGRQGQAKKRKK